MGGMKLTGERRLLRSLKALPDRVYRKAVRQTMGRAATPVVKAARRAAKRHANPKRTEGKHLFQTIAKRTRTYQTKGVIYTTVGPTWPAGAHGHLVEFGHRLPDGRMARAFPWLAVAYQAARAPALSVLRAELKKKVETEAAKLGQSNRA